MKLLPHYTFQFFDLRIDVRFGNFYTSHIRIQVLSTLHTSYFPYWSICLPAFIVQSFRFCGGCPKVGSPCRYRLWIVVKAMCVVKYYGRLALDLDVFILKGTSVMVYFHLITLYFLHLSMLLSVNWRLKYLWHLPIWSV